MSTTARRYLLTKPVTWKEGTILLATAWLVPFLVHLIPWAGPRPLGVYVLPAFWTTFVAVYFYGALPGLAIGLVTPLLNLAVTGLPAWSAVGMMGLELTFFVLAVAWLMMAWPRFWFAAPVAWLAAKGALLAILALLPTFDSADHPFQHLVRSTQNGLAGLGMLAVIHWMLVAFYPKTSA